MKTSPEIVESIAARIARMLERPRMYASRPQSLEELLQQLDDLRKFCLEIPRGGGYESYAIDKGLGAASYCHRASEAGVPEDELWNKLSQFWNDYLHSALWSR